MYLKKLTKEEGDEVEALSALFFSPEEIVIIMQLDVEEFCFERLNQPDFAIPYKRGRLMKEAELRKSIISLAINGSSPAQILAIQLIEKTNLNSIAI